MTRALFLGSSTLATLLIAAVLSGGPAVASPISVDSGWTVLPFASVPPTPEGISVDGQGRVYVCIGSSGVYRYDTTGTGGLWSSAVGLGQATASDGRTYVPSRDLLLPNHYIWNVAPDGSYTPLVSSSPGEGWAWAAVSASNLYAVISGGPGIGIYSVNTSSGATAPLVTGGPSPAGNAHWDGLTTSGESVIAAGYDGSHEGIYDVTGGTPNLVASASPWFVHGICAGPNGIYAVSADVDGGMILSFASGSPMPFARKFGDTVSIAFDSTRNRFYVLDTSPPAIWVITRAPTPTRTVSIGHIKALYR